MTETSPIEIAAKVIAGGRLILDTYFRAVDQRELDHGRNSGPPTFGDFLVAAGAQIPQLTQALNNLIDPANTALVTPPPPPSSEVMEALRRANTEINARMDALQERMQGLDKLLVALTARLRASNSANPPAPPAPPTPAPAPPIDQVDEWAKEHHGQLAGGEQAMTALEDAARSLAAEVSTMEARCPP